MSRIQILILATLAVFFLIFIGGYMYVLQHRTQQSNSTTSASSTGIPARLSIHGSQILDPSGEPIVLRGFNWGEWGATQPQDAADNVAQGANIVRIPLRWWGESTPGADSRDDSAPGHIDPAHLAVLDQTIAWATNQHLWVDLFVDSNCGQASNTNDTVKVCGAASDGSPANFENNPDAKQKFIEVWQFLANRYKNTPYIGMYEILPEPNLGCTQNGCGNNWHLAPDFYASVIPYIHAIDPSTPFLIGADSDYSVKRIDTAYIATTTPIVYTGDMLAAGSTHPEWISQYMLPFMKAHNVPFFIQQVGIPSGDQNAAQIAATILSAFNRNNIGWTWWTYRNAKPISGDFGFYYLSATGNWLEKPDWLALISKYVKGATQ